MRTNSKTNQQRLTLDMALIYPQPQLLDLLDLVLTFEKPEFSVKTTDIQDLMLQAKIPKGSSLYNKITYWIILNAPMKTGSVPKKNVISLIEGSLVDLRTNKKYYEDKIQNFKLLE